jgi:2-hydroxyacyl-CoA lyase 1
VNARPPAVDTNRPPAAAARSGHALIAARLTALGVTHVYGIGGTPVHETCAACARAGIRLVGVHHQQAAAMMAAAHNYVAGRLVAAVILSAGPAITNAVTGVLVAHDNGWPLIVLGGRRPLGMRGMGTFQDLDAVPILQSITKFAGLVASTAEIVPALDHAYAVATSGRPGPVYLDLPEEALAGAADPDVAAPAPVRVGARADPVAIAQAARLLGGARRPAVLVGEALRWSAPFDELAALVGRLDAPFATSPIAQGFIPDDHPLCAHAIRAPMLAGADVVLTAGARLDWMFRFGAEIARDAKRIHLDVDGLGMPANDTTTLVFGGDPKLTLADLLAAIDDAGPRAPRDEAWHTDLARRRVEQERAGDAIVRQGPMPMGEARLALALRRWMPRDAIVAIDGNRILAAAQRHLPSFLPVSRFTPGHNGCMGTGVPFAIGAKLAHPDRPVVVLTGDLAFGLAAMEMETALRLRVPIVVVVANNNGNGGGLSERKTYPPDAPDRYTLFRPGIRYDELVRALGGFGAHVEHADDLAPALDRAVASGIAACIDVRLAGDSG